MSKKFFFLSLLLCLMAAPVQAEILTINKVPDELKALRAAYVEQMANASTPQKLKKLQHEFEAAKAKSLLSPTFTKNVSSLEKARDLEVKKIQDRYNDRIKAMRKETLVSVERKYQVVFDSFKNQTGKNVKNQYIIDLKRLETKLIRQNDLAGALVVQTARNKAMGISATAATSAPVKKSAATVTKPVAPKPAVKKVASPTPKAAPAQNKVARKAPAPTRRLSAAAPQIYASQTKGLAGSGSNVSNNIYAFDVQLFGNQTWLSFNGYGRQTNNSFGEVYLITPGNQRHQVASWSPDQLKASNYFGVKSAKDVEAIRTDISQLVNATGTYQVEFTYRDGNEPLTIYQVEIKTW